MAAVEDPGTVLVTVVGALTGDEAPTRRLDAVWREPDIPGRLDPG